MSGWWYLLPGLGAALISALAVVVTRPAAVRLGLVDIPNERSLHRCPIPRSGGLATLVGFAAAWSALVATAPQGAMGGVPWLPLALGTGLTAAISLVDDLRGVSPRVRLAFHIAVAALLLPAGLGLTDLRLPGLDWTLGPVFGGVVTVLFVAWFTNLYNFMDGLDGLAGGMAVIGFGVLAVLGYIAGNSAFALLATAVAGAAAGFLVFNFPPARVFMGDSGSTSLGFLTALFALWGDASGAVPLWVSVLIFGPFVLDATVTLIGRMVRLERFWEPHCTHFYQRLVRSGWSPRRSVLAEFVLMIACGAAALVAATAEVSLQWAILAVVAAAFLALGRLVGRRPTDNARGQTASSFKVS